MADNQNNRVERYIRYALIVLAVVLAALLIFFIAEYRSLRQQQVINMREGRFSQLLARHAPLPVSDASTIRVWMTFDYINKLFALPPDYLKAQLQIADTHYPRLTIAEYMDTAHLDQAMLLSEVESAVRDYAPAGSATGTPGAAAVPVL